MYYLRKKECQETERIVDALEMAIAALEAKAEDEKGKPFTLEDLQEMDGKTVWIKTIHAFDEERAIVHSKYNFCRLIDGRDFTFKTYGIK